MSVVEPITSTNSTTGAGVFDSWKSFASAIDHLKHAHGADTAAVGVEIGITAVSAIADTVAFALDPLAKLMAAGVGWLIEHISFLKEPLDQLAGDPAEIKKLAEGLHKIGEKLRQASTDLDSALKAQITQWEGESANRFKNQVNTRVTQIKDAGHAVDTAGYVVETTMAVVYAARSLIRDIIATIIGEIIATALVALAMAVFTFGASIVVAVGVIVAKAVATVVALTTKVVKLTALGGRSMQRVAELASKVKPMPSKPNSHEMTPIRPQPTPGSGGHGGSGGSGGHGGGSGSGAPHNPPRNETPPPRNETPPPRNETPPPRNETPPPPRNQTPPPDQHLQDWLKWDQHLNPSSAPHPTPSGTPHPTPPPTPHPTPPPTPHPTPSQSTTPSTAGGEPKPPVSPFRAGEFEWMKKHESWLKGASWDKVKFIENWVRSSPKFSQYYPVIKAISDAKSAKNAAGWAGKTGVNLDKALTDIHMQAEQAWKEEGEQWRKDHPDPKAP
ncbi:WXG100 family type VII secretion target [Amycolatopsis jejuensis]|uniref:WXG100 family type VII secretion target n=1 Tax=Amycolatopsis jejuensis TaxID=330084 RepID=UPI0005264CE8|nr:hypothetical protein [Amycolatopsis jejuensis]